MPQSDQQDTPLSKFLHFWRHVNTQSGIKDEELWREKAAFLDKVSIQNNVVVFMWNVITNRIIYMSEKVRTLSGLEPSRYLAEDGLAFSFTRLHPNQVEGIMQLQFQFSNFFREKATIMGCDNITMNLSYLYRNADDQYIQVLQRSCILELNEDGMPSLAINFIHYVGHIKKPNAINCVFQAGDDLSLHSYNASLKAIEPPKYFSTQEKKIIQLLAHGYNTKQIAEKLSISPNTVNTHRRNLINKTECLDTTGVVAYAKLINLI